MLQRRIRRFAGRHALFGADSRVLVALSGGSDSVALLALLHDLSADGALRLVGAAHFNHQLREQAVRDERFAEALAARFGVPFFADRGDVRSRARLERRSLETAARAARHAFLERARQQAGADVVALGHTRDDQAETFLLRLLRGAGPRGLASMASRQGPFVRPLLACRRDELRAFLESRSLAFVDDESNSDVSITRNRVRAELLPLLIERFNPRIVDVLAREAELAGAIWDWLECEAAAFEGPAAGGVPAGVPDRTTVIDVARLAEAPPALRRLVVWRALASASGGRPISLEHVEAALELVAGRSTPVDLPGQRAQRIGASIVLMTEGGERVRGRAPRPRLAGLAFQYALPVPGEVPLPEAGYVLTAEIDRAGEMPRGARVGRGSLAAVRRDLCRGPFVVRNRRPGDRFRPVGLGGRKTLQDYFVDRKVARSERDQVPVVVDAEGRIVWVAGYGIDEAFQVTDPSQSVLLLRLRQV